VTQVLVDVTPSIFHSSDAVSSSAVTFENRENTRLDGHSTFLHFPESVKLGESLASFSNEAGLGRGSFLRCVAGAGAPPGLRLLVVCEGQYRHSAWLILNHYHGYTSRRNTTKVAPNAGLIPTKHNPFFIYLG